MSARAGAGFVLLLALCSGLLALGYEVLWTRALLNLLGSTTRVSALVLTAFMGGMALGAHAAARRLTGRCRHPLRWFALAEAGLGATGLLLPELLYGATAVIGVNLLRDAVLLALLLAPATLMGFALPALAAALQRQGAVQPRALALLYGLNTLGGAAAAWGVGLVVLPVLGLAATQRLAALIGLVLAVLAWIVPLRPPLPVNDRAQLSPPVAANSTPPVARKAVLAALLLGGVAALGYEVLWTRILVLVVGSSSTAFALMLGLYLAGLALGGFLAWRWRGWERRPARVLLWLQLGVAACALLGAAAYRALPAMALAGYASLGISPVSQVMVNGLLAALIILPPTAFIGASFPVGARLLQGREPQRAREVGMALALTTAGNCAGVLLVAFAVIPLLGLQSGVALLALLNTGAALILWLGERRGAGRLRFAVPAAALGTLLLAIALPPWNAAVMTSGVFRQAPVYLALLGGAGKLERAFSAYESRYYREGSEAVVAVFDRPTLDGAPHRVLTIDGKVDASTGADMATQVLSGHLPLLFKPDAQKALIIGLASGVTAGALARYPLASIDVVEIEPAVVEASRLFDAHSGRPLDDPRVGLTLTDGRQFMAQTRRRFDVIVSEPSNPWLSMSARLFTREFFELARERLTPDGILVQWVPLYGLSPAQFQALLRTLLTVFPDAALFRVGSGDLVVIAGRRLPVPGPAEVRTVFQTMGEQRSAAGLAEETDLLALWVADARGLSSTLGEGPLNTDDNGLLEFGSPWYLMRDTLADNWRLVAESSAVSLFPLRIVRQWRREPDGGEFLDRLAARYAGEDMDHALQALASALRAEGDAVRADLYQGDALAAMRRWQEAESLWRRHEGAPFWLRRAHSAMREGRPEVAAGWFTKVPVKRRSPADNQAYALALALTGEPDTALALLTPAPKEEQSLPALLAPYLRHVAHTQRGETQAAQQAWRRFEDALDGLRRCLEQEGCPQLLDAVLHWSETVGRPLGPEFAGRFRQALFLHITRPLPHYFEGVRHLWLGQEPEASKSLQTYLRLLPQPDPASRAHALLASETVLERF